VVDKRYFQGLPSPAAASLCAGLIWVIDDFKIERAEVIIGIACALTLFAGITMVSNVPFYSFKDINFRKSVPFWAIVLAVFALVVISSNPPMILFLVFVGYALSGYVLWTWRHTRR
jgi:CDP-diacylglycerol--serine O-phosphatidyltransferase